MTEERDRSGYPNPPYAGDPERGPERDGGGPRDSIPRDGNPRDGNPNGREPHQRQGFDQDGGMHRGPRRSRYGRRRMPGDGPGDQGGGHPYEHRDHQQRDPHQRDHRPQEQRDHRLHDPQRDQRPPRQDTGFDEGDNFLPSFIAGPSGGAPEHHGGPPSNQGHNPSHNAGHNPGPNPTHNAGPNPGYQANHNPGPQPGYQGPPREHGHPGQHGGQPGGYQPMHQVEREPQPEEPSPEMQAAAAEFAEWEASNPKLRGLLVCNPMVKRGEPVVRGTRIPARILAAIAKMGSSIEEMLQDYPALTREGLDAALAFAADRPRAAR